MIDTEQFVWLVRQSNSKIPPHGQGWTVAMKIDEETLAQIEDAEIVVWNLKDIEQPKQEDLLAKWDSTALANYNKSLSYYITCEDFRARFTKQELMNIRQTSMTDMEVGIFYDTCINGQEVNLKGNDISGGLSLCASKGLLDKARTPDLIKTT